MGDTELEKVQEIRDEAQLQKYAEVAAVNHIEVQNPEDAFGKNILAQEEMPGEVPLASTQPTVEEVAKAREGEELAKKGGKKKGKV